MVNAGKYASGGSVAAGGKYGTGNLSEALVHMYMATI
jgi:hypothetical protein